MEIRIVLLTLAILALPAAGTLLSGAPLSPHLQVPPVLAVAGSYSPAAFGLTMALLLAVVGFLAWVVGGGERKAVVTPCRPGPLPRWIWLGVGALAAGLPLLGGGALAQSAGQFLLLLAVTLLANALSFRLTGRSLLTHQPGFLLALTGAGAVLWWYLEYLNRYLVSWYLPDAVAMSGWQYGLYTTVAFAPALPAVLSVRQWLGAHPRLLARLGCGRPLEVGNPEGWAVALAIVASFGLLAAGAWPSRVYPLTWLSPVLLITLSQLLSGRPTLFAGARRGDWSRIVLPLIAGVGVGVLLQAANMLRPDGWHFGLPLLQEWTVFRLPLPGYAGYALFGLLCVQVGDMLATAWRRPRPTAPQRRFPLPVRVEEAPPRDGRGESR